MKKRMQKCGCEEANSFKITRDEIAIAFSLRARDGVLEFFVVKYVPYRLPSGFYELYDSFYLTFYIYYGRSRKVFDKCRFG